MTRAWPIFDTAFKEEKWLQMVVLSLFLHLGIFSTIFLFPVATIRMPSIEDRVYHVELVGFPSFSPKSDGQGNSGRINKTITKQGKGVYVSKAKAQRITVKKKKPVRIVAKRVSSKPVNANKKKETLSPSELINEAIKRTEVHAAKKTEDIIKNAITQLEKRLQKDRSVSNKGISGALDGGGQGSGGGAKGGGEQGGTSFQTGKAILIYQMEIESTIKNNWAYPVALLNLKETQAPEAKIILTVKNDGTILKTFFKKKSNNPLFDSSVLKAIEKSNPLPKFPSGYVKSYDEIEIKFNLNDLVK